MPGWSKVPVTVAPMSGPGAAPPPPRPYNFTAWELYREAYDAIQEKLKPFGCCNEFPPPNPIWDYSANDPCPGGAGTLDSFIDNTIGAGGDDSDTLVLHFTGVDWGVPPGFSGTRWVGYHSGDPDLCYIPSNYDIVFTSDFADPFTQIRATITANTYDAATHTGTITVAAAPFNNAITAGFISAPLATYLTAAASWRIYKTVTGLSAIDRRLTKPNPDEAWKGTGSAGWIDAAAGANGHIDQLVDDFNPSPYDLDVNPAVAWAADQWKNQDLLAFDGNGRLRRISIPHNGAQRIAFGNQIFKLSITGAGGSATLTLTVASAIVGSGGTTAPIAYNAAASAVQTALAAVASGATVTGAAGGPYTITIPAAVGCIGFSADSTALLGGTATIGKPDGALDFDGVFLIVPAGAKAMPGRAHDTPLEWYTGAKRSFVSMDVTDVFNGMSKPVGTVAWLELNDDDQCEEQDHLAFDTDAQIEVDNVCECGRAGDFISPGFYKSWREIQAFTLGLTRRYVDRFNNFGDGTSIRMFTPATVLSGNGINAWSGTVSYSAGPPIVINVGAPPIAMPGSTALSAGKTSIGVLWTILDAHGGIKSDGTGRVDAGGVFTGDGIGAGDDGLTIVFSAGFSRNYRRRVKYIYSRSTWIADCDDTDGCLDPPAITPGGQIATPSGLALSQSPSGGTLNYNTTYAYRVSAYNGSGETLACAEVALFTGVTRPCGAGETPPCFSIANTYAITLRWSPVLGAVGYRIYGRSGGGELLIDSTTATDYTDDGSITPAGALPASNTTHNDCWGAGTWVHRDVSSTYLDRSDFGFVGEGPLAFVPNELARVMGDNFADPADGRGGSFTTLTADAPYWARLLRRTYKRVTQAAYSANRAGTITAGGTWWFRDDTQHWSNDGAVNTGTLRIQGGTATGGSPTTLQDSSYNTGQKACWFAAGRNVGSLGGVGATPFSFFVMEVYTLGLPAGWTVAADGTATWTGMGDPPPPDFKVPVISFAAGTFTFFHAIAATVAGGFGYLIKEPKWETNRWRGRTVTITRGDGTAFRTTPRFSEDNTAFIDERTAPLQPGWTYAFDEIDANSVLKFSTTPPAASDLTTRYVQVGTDAYWVQPAGMDTRAPAVPFLAQLNANAETRVTDYGLAMGGDDVMPKLYNEWQLIVKSMRTTRQTWDNFWPDGSPNFKSADVAADNGVGGYADPSTFLGYINQPPGSYSNANTPPNPLPNGIDGTTNVFAAVTETNGPVGDPFSVAGLVLNKDNTDPSDLLLNDSGTSSEATCSRAAAYGQLTKQTCIAASVRFLSWAQSPSPIDPSACTCGACTYSDNNAGTTKCVETGYCNGSVSGCCPPNSTNTTMDAFDSGGDPVAWQKYVVWATTSPDTNATVTTPAPLGSLGSAFLPPAPTMGACDTVVAHEGWINMRRDALIDWMGMVYV